jgi:hypothetical protein
MFEPALIDTRDNRLKSLTTEVLEAIADCDDHAQLRRLAINLKMLADAARSKGWELQPKNGNRTW